MSIIAKISKLGNVAVSSAKEKIKCGYLQKNIENIDKKLKNMDDKKEAHLIIKKENKQKKIKEEKIKEKKKRETAKGELQKQILISKHKRKEETKDLNIIEKVQKEFKELPIATIVDDFVEGVSDIEKAEKIVKEHPEDMYSWLNLAETIKFYKKAFLIINGIKAPWDMIGTTLDLSVEFVGGSIESAFDKKKWTYERAINEAVKLGAGEKEIQKFKEKYKKDIVYSTAKGTVHMIGKQSKKLAKTSERLIDIAVDKLILKK